MDIGVENARLSDGIAIFIFDQVQPGPYYLKVEMSGFSAFQQENIAVLTPGDVTVNAQLAVRAVIQSVQVAGSALTLELSTTTMVQTVTGKISRICLCSRAIRLR